MDGRQPRKRAYAGSEAGVEVLKEAEPPRIAFEDLDFNFGERWIPTGVYAAYMSRLFDTDGKCLYLQAWTNFGGVRLPHHENHGRVFSEGLLPETMTACTC